MLTFAGITVHTLAFFLLKQNKEKTYFETCKSLHKHSSNLYEFGTVLILVMVLKYAFALLFLLSTKTIILIVLKKTLKLSENVASD